MKHVEYGYEWNANSCNVLLAEIEKKEKELAAFKNYTKKCFKEANQDYRNSLDNCCSMGLLVKSGSFYYLPGSSDIFMCVGIRDYRGHIELVASKDAFHASLEDYKKDSRWPQVFDTDTAKKIDQVLDFINKKC